MSDFKAKPLNLAELIDYSDDAVISKTLLKKEAGNITLFSFDRGQGLSEHTAPFDAVVQVIEGTGTFVINGTPVTAQPGEMVIMPAHIPHDVQATEAPFKMLLTMIRSQN
jgi:quercetin dioxygenase-like cupin family protein